MIQASYITVFYQAISLFIAKLWTKSSIWQYFCAAGAPKANVKGRAKRRNARSIRPTETY